MIARVWSAWTTPQSADAFAGHLERTGIREARETLGYEGHLLTRGVDEDGLVHFTLTTVWTDMDAVWASAARSTRWRRLPRGRLRLELLPAGAMPTSTTAQAQLLDRAYRLEVAAIAAG